MSFITGRSDVELLLAHSMPGSTLSSSLPTFFICVITAVSPSSPSHGLKKAFPSLTGHTTHIHALQRLQGLVELQDLVAMQWVLPVSPGSRCLTAQAGVFRNSPILCGTAV